MEQRLQAAREAKETNMAAIYAEVGSDFDMESLLAEAPDVDMTEAHVYVRPAPPPVLDDDDDDLKPVKPEEGGEEKAEEPSGVPAPGRVASTTSQASSGSNGKADVKIRLGVFK